MTVTLKSSQELLHAVISSSVIQPLPVQPFNWHQGYLSGAGEAEPAHKRAGPLLQEEAEPIVTGTSLMTHDHNFLKLQFKAHFFVAHLMSQGSPARVEPAAEEAAQTEEVELPVSVPGVEPKSDLTTGITSAFSTFKAQLEEHFTVSTAEHLAECCFRGWWLSHHPAEGVDHEVGLRSCLQGCWRDVEAEVLQSFKDCQQEVSALLADVHQQR